MGKTAFTPAPSRKQEISEDISAAVAFVILFGLHLLILRPPLPRSTLLLYTLLTLALAGVYVISGLRGAMQQVARAGTRAVLPIFLLGNGLILATALTLWGRAPFYFCLFLLNGYGALVHYTGRRPWALAFAGGMVAFAWLAYAWQQGWSAAGAAWLDDLPWYALTIALAEIVARQREHREQVEALAAELEEANRQLRQYAAQAEELAVTRERARLANELHDSVGHTLTALDVQLELLVRLPADRTAQRQQATRQARTLVKEGLADLRRAVQALRPAVLETFSLPEAIGVLLSDFDIPTTWQVTGEIAPLPPRLSLPLYRAAQEALTNIQRHAPAARRVTVRLRYEPDAVTLTVENDGVPSPARAGSVVPMVRHRGQSGAQARTVVRAEQEEGGHGLRGLRERAEALGGDFQAGPDGEDGFRLEMRLPMT